MSPPIIYLMLSSDLIFACSIFRNFRVLVEQLERMNLSQMEPNAQTAFWINVHNALVMHVKVI